MVNNNLSMNVTKVSGDLLNDDCEFDGIEGSYLKKYLKTHVVILFQFFGRK